MPHILNNVSQRSQKTSLLGHDCASPFGIAPMGISALTAFRGDIVLAESAAKAGIPMIMSGSSLTRMEDVAKAAPQSWFQVYLPPTPERIASLVDRAARAGFQTLVVTVDSAIRGSMENYSRAGFIRACSNYFRRRERAQSGGNRGARFSPFPAGCGQKGPAPRYKALPGLDPGCILRLAHELFDEQRVLRK